ncbi:alpha-ketoacid dehydrogenase subunit beta [Streptosporangium lutulentum]
MAQLTLSSTVTPAPKGTRHDADDLPRRRGTGHRTRTRTRRQGGLPRRGRRRGGRRVQGDRRTARRFGPLRVADTPISEQAILGAAMGAAMTGLRPIAEIMFSDFLAVCWDLVANEIAKTRYMTNGQISLPLVIRTGNGGGLRFGAQHSQSLENWAMAVPGLKVVAPSTPEDVVGLLAAAVRDPDPVMFFEHKGLYPTKGRSPTGRSSTPWAPRRCGGGEPTARSSRWPRWCPGR